ncbi:MAG: aminotransferase class IV, partial [Archaeoglobaceae archaeon]
MPDLTAFVNGEFLPAKEAAVSVFDRGLRWGDGIYDVERTFKHVPFRLDYHLERLERSLRYTRMTLDISINETGDLIEQLVRRNSKKISPESDLEVVQIITRGDVGAMPSPRIIMYCREL